MKTSLMADILKILNHSRNKNNNNVGQSTISVNSYPIKQSQHLILGHSESKKSHKKSKTNHNCFFNKANQVEKNIKSKTKIANISHSFGKRNR